MTAGYPSSTGMQTISTRNHLNTCVYKKKDEQRTATSLSEPCWWQTQTITFKNYSWSRKPLIIELHRFYSHKNDSTWKTCFWSTWKYLEKLTVPTFNKVNSSQGQTQHITSVRVTYALKDQIEIRRLCTSKTRRHLLGKKTTMLYNHFLQVGKFQTIYKSRRQTPPSEPTIRCV